MCDTRKNEKRDIKKKNDPYIVMDKQERRYPK